MIGCGMNAKDIGKNRWVYPILCFFVTFLGGTLYSYSIIGYELQKLWGISVAEAGIPYFAFLCGYGYLMVLGGIFERRFRSEKIPMYLGAILFGLGFTNAGFVDRNIALFSMSYFVAGLGIALMDSMTLPIATSWVPDKPGLAVGIVRTGFGIAPLIVAPLFEHLFKVYGFSFSLRIVGILYLAISLTIAYLVKMNPSARKTKEYEDLGKALNDILSRKCFWLIWLLYFAGLFTPLAFIGYVKQIGVELASINPELMGYAIAVFSIFNGVGGIIYGKIIDSKGFLFTATLNYSSTILALATLWLYPSRPVFLILSPIIYLSLGGWMVIAPTEIRTITAHEKYSLSWPLLMTSYATAVLIGTMAMGIVRDALGEFRAVFPVLITIIVVLGLIPIYATYRNTCGSLAKKRKQV
ncbi:MAG: MFS transporter [Ignisphaera sp.]|uniref:MFS transporter n=2 Tax=Ignisphaera aggregans TaxID=334771 RepID=A0A7C4JKL0_9CREN